MNVVLKSGGNQHHGTAYEYMRRFAPGRQYVSEQRHRHAQAHALSGPIRRSSWKDRSASRKLLKKDSALKLFYMGAFENYREGTPNPLIVSYPDAGNAER